MHEKNGQSWQAKYDPAALGDVPAVCVRIPTGGGKTFLAAHAVAQAGKTLRDTAAPVALWLVPSDAIRSQTLAALSTPRNPCREALTQHFGERVRVCALDDLATVGPQEVGHSAIIIVATIQSFNVKDKTIRTVYSFDESLAPHFQGLTPKQENRLDKVTEADIAAQPYLTAADLGRVKASLANWLTLHQPIVIVDEAHNNRTEQAFRTLRELHPACLIELTATPMPDSNVIFQSASTPFGGLLGKVFPGVNNGKDFDDVRHFVKNNVIWMNHDLPCACQTKTWLVKVRVFREMLQRALYPFVQINCGRLISLSNERHDLQ